MKESPPAQIKSQQAGDDDHGGDEEAKKQCMGGSCCGYMLTGQPHFCEQQ